MVDAKLRFKTVVGAAEWRFHDPRIVDQSLQLWMLAVDLDRKGAQGSKIVQRQPVHGQLCRRQRLPDFSSDTLPFLDPAYAHDDGHALLGQLLGGHQADAGIGAGDNLSLAAQILPENFRTNH